MPENIVKRIKKAELEADKAIDTAKKKAISIINKAREKSEAETKSFESNSIERLKKFCAEKEKHYKVEAEQIKNNGEKAKTEYLKKIEAKFPTIKEKVSELIRKELCL
jgi:vacuolar-type H+-ATPase subunit H